MPQSGMFLILSGIEGLANFAHGNPEFAISAALMDGQTVLAGVVYNPARDELFFAEKGKGAFKEGFRSHERLRMAAGILLVKEAGGLVLDMEQEDTRTEDLPMVLNSGNLMAASFNLSQKIAKILK